MNCYTFEYQLFYFRHSHQLLSCVCVCVCVCVCFGGQVGVILWFQTIVLPHNTQDRGVN